MIINRSLIYVRLNYFCQFFVISAFFVYLNPILASHGLSAYQIGVTSFLSNIAATMSRLIFGPLADGTRRKNWVVAGLSASTAVFITQFVFLPTATEALYRGFVDEDWRFTTRLTVKYKNSLANQSNLSGLPCWPSMLKQCKVVLPDTSIYPIEGSLQLGGHSDDGLTATYMVPPSSLSNSVIQREFIKLICLTEGSSDFYPCTPIQNHSKGIASLWILIFAITLRCLVSTAHAPLPNLLDSATYNLLGEENAHKYGRTRSFGSAGFVAGALVCGSLVSLISNRKSEDVKMVWLGFNSTSNPVTASNFVAPIYLGTGAAVLGAFISSLSIKNTMPQQTKLSVAIMIGLRSSSMIKCIINSLLAGLIYSFFFEYFFFVLTERFAVPPYFMGLLTSVIVIGEIPAFIISGLIMKRVGETACLCIGHLLFALRFFSFAYFENYWIYLFTDTLFGTSFSFTYNALISQAGTAGRNVSETGANVVNSMHALMNAIMFGVTACIGGGCWGFLLEYYTGRQLFYATAISAIVLCLFTPLISVMVDKFFPNIQQNAPSIVMQ